MESKLAKKISCLEAMNFPVLINLGSHDFFEH